MKFNLDKIINNLDEYKPNKPIFYENYLFHYLIILDKLDILKKYKHPVYKLNEDGLDGFMLAAKYENLPILKYLLKEYPEYAQNHNKEGLNFINYFKNPSKIITLMKEFKSIDWSYLFKFKNEKNIDFFCYFISILDYNDLIFYLPETKNFFVFYVIKSILLNNIISIKQKKELLDKYSDADINSKDNENIGLLLTVISIEDIILTEYLISRNIDLDYILKPITNFITPLYYLYTKLSFGSDKNLEKILELIWNKIYSKLDFNYINKMGESYIIMTLLNSRNTSPIYKKITEFILKNSPDSCWNIVTVEKENALFYLIDKPYDSYSKYVKNRSLDTKLTNRKNENIFDIIDKNSSINNYLKWKKLLLNLKLYKEPKLDITLEDNKYQHYTKFTATMIDIIIYFIHLDKKYKNLFVPKILDVNKNRKDFPFVITYDEALNMLDIHPKLNTIINNIRREKSHDFAVLFLSLSLADDLKHANILLYDINNLTLERFEPYGDDGVDNIMDDLLEEELTWNTGFKYLRPKDFLPKPSYQSLSYEGNESLKAGDFGGFCLGWCIWYIEHRLKNPKVEPKLLNQKTLEKMLKLDNTFTEFIRNYSNKLFDCKLRIVKKICPNNECIPEKNISNLYLSKEDESKIIVHAEEYFEFKNKAI